MNNQSEKLRRYFLGALSPVDAEEIEQQIIDDAEFEGEVHAAENDLVEDYIDKALSADELRLFTENYLITPERRKNIESVAVLRQYSRVNFREESPPASSAEDDTPNFFERLRAWLSAIPSIAYAACVLLLIGAIAVYFWIGRSEYRQLQTEYAALNQQDLSDLEPYKKYQGFTAQSGSLRGAGTGIKIAAGDSRMLLARLALPLEFNEKPAFNVKLIKDKSVLLEFESVRAYESDGGRELRLLLPGVSLEKGAYRLEAAPTDKPDAPLSYYFSIE